MPESLAHNFPDSVNEYVAAKQAAEALIADLDNGRSISPEALQKVRTQLEVFLAVESEQPKNVETFLRAMDQHIRWTTEERAQVQEALLTE